MLVVVLFSLLVVIHLHNLMQLDLFIQILTLPAHLVQSPLTNAVDERACSSDASACEA